MIASVMLAIAAASLQEPQPSQPSTAPLSAAMRAGDTLYVSGNLGRVPAGMDPHGDGFDAAVQEAMDEIADTLKAHGADWSKVVKCTVMLADVPDWPRLNAVYATYFKPSSRLPARSAFGANGLALGATVKVECIAWLGQ